MMSRFYMQPWSEFSSTQYPLNRMLNHYLQARSNPFVKSELMKFVRTPAIELQNSENALVLRAEVPGLAAKDLDVQVSGKTVVIAGNYEQKSTENQGSVRTEIRYGQFHRVINLPVPVVADRVEAELKDGILTLILPKLSAVRPAVVKVNVVEETSNNSTEVSEPAEVVESSPTVAQADTDVTQDVWAA